LRIALKLAILQSGWSQRDVAAQTHIPEARLSSIIRGWVAPRPDERMALQQCLRVGLEAFTSSSEGLEPRSVRR
jgi:hypothetical protein